MLHKNLFCHKSRIWKKFGRKSPNLCSLLLLVIFFLVPWCNSLVDSSYYIKFRLKREAQEDDPTLYIFPSMQMDKFAPSEDPTPVVEVRYLGKPPLPVLQDTENWKYNSLEESTPAATGLQTTPSTLTRTTWNPDAIDVTVNPNKPRKGSPTKTTDSTSVITSVTTSYSEVSTKLSSAENLTASSDYQKWQELKKQFLDGLQEDTSEKKVEVSSVDPNEIVNNIINSQLERLENKDDERENQMQTNLKWNGLSEDSEDGSKFPNFPPNTEVTNRTPRDYSPSTTLTRVSSVTTPSPSVSTAYSAPNLRFSSISTTEYPDITTKGSILATLYSTTEGPIVFSLSPELHNNIPDGYELIPVDKLTNEYEVVPFDKVIEVLNVSSISPVPDFGTTPGPGDSNSMYGNDFNKIEDAYKMLTPLTHRPKVSSTTKPMYIPSFFSDTNKLLTMYKPPPFSPDLPDDPGKSSNSSPGLPTVFYNDFPRPGMEDNVYQYNSYEDFPRPRNQPVVKSLSDLATYDPRRQREKPRIIHFGADFNEPTHTPIKSLPTPYPSPTPSPYPSPTPSPYPSPTPSPYPSPTPSPFPSQTPSPFPSPSPTPIPYPSPTPYSASSPSPSYSSSEPPPGLSIEDIKTLPAPSILMQALGLLNYSPPPRPTPSLQSPHSTSSLPYSHWTVNPGDETTPYSKVKFSSPISAVKKLPSLFMTPPNIEPDSTYGPVVVSSLGPTNYVSTRRLVPDIQEYYSTPRPTPRTSTISYSTPSSKVFLHSISPDEDYPPPDAYDPHHHPEIFHRPHSHPIQEDVYHSTPPNYDYTPQSEFPSSTPFSAKDLAEILSNLHLLQHSTVDPPAEHGHHHEYSTTPRPTEPSYKQTPINVYQAPHEPHPPHHEEHNYFHPEHFATPAPEIPVDLHRKSYEKYDPTVGQHHHKHQHHSHETKHHPVPHDVNLKFLSEKLLDLYQAAPLPDKSSHGEHGPSPETSANHFDHNFHGIFEAMKKQHHDYSPSPSDLSQVKSLPDFTNKYLHPHHGREDETSEVKSLPQYLSNPYHYGGLPIEHSPPGVKTLRPKVSNRPHNSFYSTPKPVYTELDQPAPIPETPTQSLVSQLHPAIYPPRPQQDPSMSHVSYLPLPINPSYDGINSQSQMSPPTFIDNSKSTETEPIRFKIKDIESLQRALKRAGVSENTMKNVILTKEENGETHVQISVPIAELFKAMGDGSGSSEEASSEETSFKEPIFYNDLFKKESALPTLFYTDAEKINSTEVQIKSDAESPPAGDVPITFPEAIPSTSSTLPPTPVSTTTTTVTTVTTTLTTPTITTTTIATTRPTTTTIVTTRPTTTTIVTTRPTTTTTFVPKKVVLTKDNSGFKVEADDEGEIDLSQLSGGGKLEGESISPDEMNTLSFIELLRGGTLTENEKKKVLLDLRGEEVPPTDQPVTSSTGVSSTVTVSFTTDNEEQQFLNRDPKHGFLSLDDLSPNQIDEDPLIVLPEIATPSVIRISAYDNITGIDPGLRDQMDPSEKMLKDLTETMMNLVSTVEGLNSTVMSALHVQAPPPILVSEQPSAEKMKLLQTEIAKLTKTVHDLKALQEEARQSESLQFFDDGFGVEEQGNLLDLSAFQEMAIPTDASAQSPSPSPTPSTSVILPVEETSDVPITTFNWFTSTPSTRRPTSSKSPTTKKSAATTERLTTTSKSKDDFFPSSEGDGFLEITVSGSMGGKSQRLTNPAVIDPGLQFNVETDDPKAVGASIVVSDEPYVSPLPPGSAGFGSVEPVTLEELISMGFDDRDPIGGKQTPEREEVTTQASKKKKNKKKNKTSNSAKTTLTSKEELILQQQELIIQMKEHLEKQQQSEKSQKLQLANFQDNASRLGNGNFGANSQNNVPQFSSNNFGNNVDNLQEYNPTSRPVQTGTFSFPSQRPELPVSVTFPYESIQSLPTQTPIVNQYVSSTSFDDSLPEYHPTSKPIFGSTVYQSDLAQYSPTSRPVQIPQLTPSSYIEQSQYNLVSTPSQSQYGQPSFQNNDNNNNNLPQYLGNGNSDFRGSPNGETWFPVQNQQQPVYQSGFGSTTPSPVSYGSSSRPVRFPNPNQPYSSSRHDPHEMPYYDDDDYGQHDEWYDPMTNSYHYPSMSQTPKSSPLVPPPSYGKNHYQSLDSKSPVNIIAELAKNSNRKNLLDNGNPGVNPYISYDSNAETKGSEIIMYPSGQLMLGADPDEAPTSTIGPKLESYLTASFNEGPKLRSQMPYYVLTKKKEEDEEDESGEKDKEDSGGLLPMLFRTAKDDLKLVGNVIKYALA